MIYYFAYGSNMDEQQMKERCPEAVLIGKGRLDGYALGFTIYSPNPKRECGCADIIKDPSQSVWGLLYTVTSEDLKSLDKAEGMPNFYRRISVFIVDQDGNILDAQAYEVVHKKIEFQKPSLDYLGKLTTAAKTYDFPKEYQDMLTKLETKGL